MRTVEKTLYLFSELSDEAKERARDWYRGTIDGQELADYIDYLTCAKILGIEIATDRHNPKIYWSGFSSQGDGACFVGRYEYAKGAAKAIRQYATLDSELHRIADALQAVQSRNFYRLWADVTRGHLSNHYSHSGTMSVDVYHGDDRDVSEAVEETVTQLMRDFADWIYSRLDSENTHLMTDESVDESIVANEYEFDAEGNVQ